MQPGFHSIRSRTYCSFLSCWEFHYFNWPFTLPAVPNALVYDKAYWERSRRVINFRRDGSVITKWANTTFELMIAFSALLPIFPMFADRQSQDSLWIIHEFSWIRWLALFVVPCELIVSSYKVYFWHIEYVLKIFNFFHYF